VYSDIWPLLPLSIDDSLGMILCLELKETQAAGSVMSCVIAQKPQNARCTHNTHPTNSQDCSTSRIEASTSRFQVLRADEGIRPPSNAVLVYIPKLTELWKDPFGQGERPDLFLKCPPSLNQTWHDQTQNEAKGLHLEVKSAHLVYPIIEIRKMGRPAQEQGEAICRFLSIAKLDVSEEVRDPGTRLPGGKC
jgi:hypothetical protein